MGGQEDHEMRQEKKQSGRECEDEATKFLVVSQGMAYSGSKLDMFLADRY